jgi:PAS domain S-box-containing protein
VQDRPVSQPRFDADEASRERESRYRRLFDNLGESLVVYTIVRDGSGEIVDWVVDDANEEMLRRTGATLDRLRGRRASELFGADAIAPYVARSRRVLATGRGETFEEAFAWDGRHYLTSMFVLDHWHVVTASVDVTERVRADAALRESDRRKTEFLGMLSHELRNPLAPIRSALDVLDRVPMASAQAARAREVIARQADHLTHLVDDLLDMTRISRGQISLHRERVDLGDLLRRAAEDHRSTLAARRIALEVRCTEEPLPVHADPTRLAQVLGNLLSNAAKFSECGGHVGVSVSRDGEDAVLSVRDDGMGIDPALLPRVFEPFVQADDGLPRTRGGLGLGLSLVRALVEMHGGSIRAASGGIGRGAEFVVTIPLAAAVAPSLRPIRDALSGAGPRRILVIEDNADAAEMMRELLETADHAVEVANDGRAGLDRARSMHPDVVLCDIGLPEMDGYEVARALRSDPSLAETFLVAVSGYALPDDLARASEAGFDRHLAKPITLEQLSSVLAAVPRADAQA